MRQQETVNHKESLAPPWGHQNNDSCQRRVRLRLEPPLEMEAALGWTSCSHRPWAQIIGLDLCATSVLPNLAFLR